MDALNAAPRPRNMSHLTCTAGWLAAGLLLTGCDRPGHGEASFSDPITYKPAGQTFALGKNDSERFGVSARDFARAAGAGGGASAKGGGKVHWETPAGWVELAPTGTREANFKVAGDAQTECYLTRGWTRVEHQPLAGADLAAAAIGRGDRAAAAPRVARRRSGARQLRGPVEGHVGHRSRGRLASRRPLVGAP